MDHAQLTQLITLIEMLNAMQNNQFDDNRMEIEQVFFRTTDSEQNYQLEWLSDNGFYVIPVVSE